MAQKGERMRSVIFLPSREDWLKARNGSIGGSDASAILGMNPYMSNVELWEIKTGRKEVKEISGNPYVEYGAKAEEHLRELFKLDFPKLKVQYQPNNMFTNDAYPRRHTSLDGWIEDSRGRFGVLEIKTSEMQSRLAKAKWDGGIPQNYYMQVLHSMIITQASFAVVCAQLRWSRDGDVLKMTKHYTIEREDVKCDINELIRAENRFVEYLASGKCPPLALDI